eukprot:Pgem_evm3s2062
MVFYLNPSIDFNQSTQSQESTITEETMDNYPLVKSPFILSKLNSVILIDIKNYDLNFANNTYIEILDKAICFFFNSEIIDNDIYIKVKFVLGLVGDV